MDMIVYPGVICGRIGAVASKSHLHRLLICAALSQGETTIRHGALCDDIDSTCRCLRALGADITLREGEILVRGMGARRVPRAEFACGESGSTYRFLLPVACALGADSSFLLSGRLPQRPIGDLLEQMTLHGARASGLGSACVRIRGRLSGGEFTLPGNVSSQYITALLFAMPLTGQDCTLTVTGHLESAAYVDLTLDVLRLFGVQIAREGNVFRVASGQAFLSPGVIRADGDWSNVAFALCAAAASGGSARIEGLPPLSAQGDKAVLEIIRRFGAQAEMQGDAACVRGAALQACRVDIGQIPDMAPALSLLGAMARGETVLCNAGRLRLKESDRIESTLQLLRGIGARAWAEGDEIHIAGTGGKQLPGGEADACNDHRIAMTAGCAAALCSGPVVIHGAECVAKSYPGFFEDLPRLGLKGEKRS